MGGFPSILLCLIVTMCKVSSGTSQQVPYRITEVFTNVTVLFQRVKVNKRINIKRLTPNFV